MLFDSEVRLFVLYRPVAFHIARKLQWLAILILLAFLGIAMRAFLFQLIIAKRSTGGLYQAGVHGHALIDGKPLGLELAQDLGVDLFHGGLAQPAAEA